jgi:hypothetical protein
VTCPASLSSRVRRGAPHSSKPVLINFVWILCLATSFFLASSFFFSMKISSQFRFFVGPRISDLDFVSLQM